MSIVANFNALLADLLSIRERAAGRLTDAETAGLVDRLDGMWGKLSSTEQDEMIEAALRRRVMARMGQD